MINNITKNKDGQTILVVTTHVNSLSGVYMGPIRGKNAPQLIMKFIPGCGYQQVCSVCSMSPTFCLCDDKIRDVEDMDDYSYYESNIN